MTVANTQTVSPANNEL